MELYKKLQINKKSLKQRFPAKLSIKIDKNKNFNQSKESNELYNLTTNQLFNKQVNESKYNKFKKFNYQPLNFYINSINKIYNNSDRSINISNQNPYSYSLNNEKNISYNLKNKIYPVNASINHTINIIEPNSAIITNRKNRNSLNENILNYKLNFDDNLHKKKKSVYLNTTEDNIHFNQIYLNRKAMQGQRSYSGDNKRNNNDKIFLNLIRNASTSFKKSNSKQKFNDKNKNAINDLNYRYLVNNISQLKNKNNKINAKLNINKKKSKLREKPHIELRQIKQIRNNEYIPYINRSNKENNKKMNSIKINQIQKYPKNIKDKKILDKKKLKITLIPNDNNTISTSTSNKIKKNNFNFESIDLISFNKNVDNFYSNRINLQTLQNEPRLTLKKTNINTFESISKSDHNHKSQNKNNFKRNNTNNQFIPMIYKKRKAISPLTSTKKKKLIFFQKDGKTNSGEDIKNIILNNNNFSPLLKNREKHNITKVNSNFNIKTEALKNQNLNINQLNRSNNSYKVYLDPSAFRLSLSQKNIHSQKENKNNSQTISKKNILKKGKEFKIVNINLTEKNNFIIKKNSSICQGGENYPYEEKKINQDNLFKTKFDDLNISFYGVCDGHGDNGHLISEFIKINLPLVMYMEIKSLFYLINNKENHTKDKIVAYFTEICKQSFDIINKKLILNKKIDTSLSGSTCISLLFYEDLIISANLGDSRAIMGKLNNNKWTYESLSRDHKPSEIDEALRIKYKNGIIHPYMNENGFYKGPNRIWIEGQGIPGLAMTRSFGDEIGSTVGVLSEPEIKIFNYEKEDKFIIIGSDGLWEYISCQEAINIVGEFYKDNNLNSDAAVLKLFQTSRNKWMENQGCIDDISIIILFLE